MKIPTALLDATRSRFWRTTGTPPVRLVQPAVVDVADEPASPAEPPARYEPGAVAHVSMPPTVTPGDTLLAALDAASDDAQRAALLIGASVQAREQLPATLAYREMSTLTGRNPPLGALVSALDGATNESGRAALLSATAPALLVELAEHLLGGPLDVITQQYMDMLATTAQI